MVFGLFSKEKSLQRTIEKATNKLAQSADRWGAMEKLRDDGSEEALLGLCKRFGITSTKSVEDEQEKSWVVDTLVGVGDVALPALRRYMKGAPNLAFQLKALERIADKPKALAAVDELLALEEPGYTRDPDRRLDIIRWLTEWTPATSDDVVPRIAPYLADFDENVRYAAVDGLAHHDMAQVGPRLVAALVRPEEESGRVKRRLAELIAEHKVSLGEHTAKIPGLLVGPVAGFRVQGDLLVALYASARGLGPDGGRGGSTGSPEIRVAEDLCRLLKLSRNVRYGSEE
jgi:hypothetical protein